MTPIEQFRAAGFSDKEIGDWTGEQRPAWRTAGFSDDEIDKYLGGPKPQASPAFLDRLRGGVATLDGRVPSGAALAYGGADDAGVGNFLTGLWKGLTTPGAQLKETFAKAGPGEAFGGLMGRIPIGQVIDQIRQGGESAGAALTGQPVSAEEMVGNALLGMTAPVTRLPGGPITRLDRSPTGQLIETPVGGLPERGDASDAVSAVVGLPHPAAQAKVERLWEDHGIHPAEVAHDAARDPTIAQDLLSSGPELPRAYVKPADQPSARPAPVPETPPPVEQPAAPAAEATQTSPAAETPPQLRAFAPGDLRVDAQRFQFKEGADAAGVTERLQGVTQWDALKAGLTVVYEDNQGQHWIADGHQRLGLAKRIEQADPGQAPRLNSWVLREADGVTDADVRAIAASKNIAEGTGTAVDAAKVLRDRPDLMGALPPRSELVRQSRGLMNLDPEAFGKVVNDVVPPNYASIVGRLAESDPKMQNALIDLLAKTQPENAVQAESIVRSGLDAGLHTETQATLFGDQELVSSLYADRARILDRSLKQLRRDRTVFQSIVDNSAIIEDLGNTLARDENARRAATDGHAVQILQTLANRRGALSDTLTGIARSVAAGERDLTGGARDFVAEIRRQAESGALTRGADGGSGSAVGAPRAGGPGTRDTAELAADGTERQPRDVGPAEEARAAQQAAEAIKPPEQPPTVEQTDQGAQLVMPGAERSARQAAQAREDAGRGRATTDTPQQEPGGLFAPPPESEQPGLFGRLATDESGALRLTRPTPPRTAAEQTILDKINVGGRDKRPLTWSGFYTDFIDRTHPIEKAVDETGQVLPTLQNPHRLARLMAGTADRARYWLEHGQVDFKTQQKIGRGMEEIIAPVRDDMDGLRAFGASIRTLELENRDIKSGLNLSAAREVAAAGLDKYGPIMAELIQYQNNLAKHLRDAGVLSQDGYTAMLEANRLYMPFYRIIGDEPGGMRGAGGSMQASNPIHRIEGSEHDIVDPIESIIRNTHLYLTMAERNRVGTALVDLLSPSGAAHRPRSPTIATPAQHFAPPAIPAPHHPPGTPAAALEQAVTDLLKTHGLSGNLFDFAMDAAALREGEISIFRNGSRETWQVGGDLADAMKGLDAESANTIVRMLAMPARALRAGATLTPEFILRNPVRDFLSAFVQTSVGVFNPSRSARGLYSSVVKDEHFQDWLKAGGGNAALVSMDRRYLQENLRKLTEDTGLMTRAWNVARHPLDLLRTVSELSEQMTRVGEFRAVQARELRKGTPPQEADAAAAFASREVTVDFARMGAKMRAANMLVAFINAQVQGVDRLARAIKDNPVRTGARIAAGITIPSVLLWAVNHDDPDYQELPDWQRDLFWIVPMGSAPPSPLHIAQAEARGEEPKPSAYFFLRIPKPFELGVLFGSGVERTLDAFVADQPDAYSGLAKSIAGALLPSVAPTAVLPVAEQWANRSSFTDRNLIPAQMEKMLPEYQYTPYTTELAKKLGQIITAFPGVRDAAMSDGPASGVARALSTPILFENYVRGWTGGLGNYALQAVDASLRKAGMLPDPPKPEDTLSDIPVVKAFVVRHPSSSAESIQQFYDGYARNKRYFDTWIAKAQEGDAVAMDRIMAAGGSRIFVQLDAIKQTLGQHSELVRDIWKDPDMAPGEKRQFIDQLYFSEIQIAKGANDMMRQVDTSLAPPP